ncbi:heat shock protein Hsp20 domain-containing protein [Dictyostelium discoideum AX4]|uniref:Small heat shock protein hspG1 n=1 Tax=Dictyostelium discoideum TaxID=44689 RepID=HSPG1_DICDI|nr:heat shock protein Hsp20 domain-containing protein [Dictyostelium discoideum AX4]Q86I25.1 RecName: Full=Small heat shock protein hspG1 [Dictyostelium discoideum]EAL69820.1 heat shock protein Hsp20 domain-containing protein [Dictyostelium discoideum AX4]|eukprot:XP_643793.1 heat shock protein Hsp20 domain-containing protein [Dictyostelium discoideum AX4]
MATIFDILNSINNKNNNHSNYYSCKRLKSNNNNNNNNFRNNSIKRIDIIPSMDVTITDNNIIIETELAGISKDNIEIDIKDSILTIQGEKKINNNYKQQQQQHSDKTKTNNELPLIEENKKEFRKYLSERSFGNFKRCLDLTSILYQLDLSTIKSNFENGLLIITINKKSDLSNSSFKININ